MKPACPRDRVSESTVSGRTENREQRTASWETGRGLEACAGCTARSGHQRANEGRRAREGRGLGTGWRGAGGGDWGRGRGLGTGDWLERGGGARTGDWGSEVGCMTPVEPTGEAGGALTRAFCRVPARPRRAPGTGTRTFRLPRPRPGPCRHRRPSLSTVQRQTAADTRRGWMSLPSQDETKMPESGDCPICTPAAAPPWRRQPPSSADARAVASGSLLGHRRLAR